MVVRVLRDLQGVERRARVPARAGGEEGGDVVGDVNKGWLVARATLGNERISIGGGSGADRISRAASIPSRFICRQTLRTP